MAGFEDATDEELVEIAEKYPDEFAREHVDRWTAYFESLDERHLEMGLERAVQAVERDRNLFAWLFAPFVSRLTEETALSVLDDLQETIDRENFAEMVASVATFAPSPRTRRTVRVQYESVFEEMTAPMRRGIELQFEDSPTDFRREWLHGWVTEYRSSVSYLTRCALCNFEENPEGSVHVWAHGFPIRPAKPTDELASALRSIHEETQAYYDDRERPLELYKGTTFERTIASSAESWTDDEDVAEEYDGHSVYERDIDPETVFFSYEVVAERANVYTSQARNTFKEDSEYVVFGGGI